MLTRPHRIPNLLLWLVLALASGAFYAQQAAQGPSSSLQELVRGWSQGLSDGELLQRVESAAPPIQIDPEIAAELKRSGFPAAVLAALQRRAELVCPGDTDCATESGDTTAATSSYTVSVEFSDAARFKEGDTSADARTLGLPDSLPRSLRAALGNTPEDVRLDDIGLYVLLTNPTEVPDQWQVHTQLGDDGRIPRHKMLLFLDGATRQERSGLSKRFRSMLGDRSNLLELTLPESANLELPQAEPATLVIGLAGRIGDSYFAISEPRALSLDPAPAASTLILTWKSARAAFQPSSFDLKVKAAGQPETESPDGQKRIDGSRN